MITVNFTGDDALYIELYDYLKRDIVEKRRAPKTKLPSKRELAAHLGISLNTVTAAYDMLLDEGYIYSKERVGYFTSAIENLHYFEPVRDEEIKVPTPKARYDFDLNKNGDFDFPDTHFKRTLIESLGEEDRLNDRQKEGVLELRVAISEYLRASRGIDVRPERIILSAGMEYLLQILFLLIPKDYIYYLENPGYVGVQKIFTQNERKIRRIDIDEGGIDVAQLKEEKAVYLITPSHQYPTGSILRVDRRIKLLNHANQTAAYIIEDDYDSEYKYYGRPIPALKSLDTVDRVIYMSNFAKSLSPTLRISFMVLPEALMARFKALDPINNCPIPTLVQLALAKYMSRGYFERHLNKQRKRYDRRRQIATAAFEGDDRFDVDDKRCGMHFILTCKIPCKEGSLLAHLRKKGIHILGLGDFYMGTDCPPDPKLIVGYGNMDIETLKKGLSALKTSILEMGSR